MSETAYFDDYPLFVTDERVLQVQGAVEQYAAYGMGTPSERPDRIHDMAVGLDQSVISMDSEALADFEEYLDIQVEEAGCLEVALRSRADLATVVAALSYALWCSEASDGGHRYDFDKGLTEAALEDLLPLLEKGVAICVDD